MPVGGRRRTATELVQDKRNNLANSVLVRNKPRLAADYLAIATVTPSAITHIKQSSAFNQDSLRGSSAECALYPGERVIL
jgi:hypothetical protein